MINEQIFRSGTNPPLSVIQSIGTNLIYYRNPQMVAWWSAALPGFGHILLGQYVKGVHFFIWEIVVNVCSGLNLGLVYTVQGEFDKTKEVLDPLWILLYVSIYLFSIWDSFRAATDLNQAISAPKKWDSYYNMNAISVYEINIFSKKKPFMALFWSIFLPGTGQFYLHRLLEAVFFMTWFVVFCYYSHFFEGVLYLLDGELTRSNEVINIEWFMFLPSIFFFSAYNAYSDAIETNIIFSINQTNALKEAYQHDNFEVIFPKQKEW